MPVEIPHTMKDRFRLLLELETRREQLQEEHSPKIQRVAHHLRDREDFAKHYLPKLVSFGPIHHGDPNLQQGEQYKLMWTAMYVNSTGQNAEYLHKRIADSIEELKNLFDKDLFTKLESQGFQSLDEKLSWMLFVDGCSLLQILDKGRLDEDFNYQKLNLKLDQLILVRRDVLLLENQLPYPLLRLLCSDVNPDSKLRESMYNFLRTHHLWSEPSSTSANEENKHLKRPSAEQDNLHRECTLVLEPPPIHLLDCLRRNMVDDHSSKKDPEDVIVKITHRNIQELKASGIRLRKIDSRRPKDIEFFAGKLMLPDIIVDDTTAPALLNLIAYEMCPDFQNDYGISSFVAFLDSLIDNPEDVKLLRKKGILRNALGSDEDVSTLFNTISTDLVTNVGSYSRVRKDIERHYKNKWKTLMYQAWSTYFKSPWAFIALLAAIFGLVLTFIQTWYSVK